MTISERHWLAKRAALERRRTLMHIAFAVACAVAAGFFWRWFHA